MRRLLLPVLAVLLGCACLKAGAQAVPTATRLGDVQVGGGYTGANSDYTTNIIRGFAFYGDVDFVPRLGMEFDFHQLNDPQPTKVYERSYEVGGRFVLHHGDVINPYVKVLYGRGVFNFPKDSGNLAYNMVVGGGGIDFRVKRWLNVRADYEYQRWLSGPALDQGLNPQLVTIGVAYHVPAGTPNHTGLRRR